MTTGVEHLLEARRTLRDMLDDMLDVRGVCQAVLGAVENVLGADSSWIMTYHSAPPPMLQTVCFRSRGPDDALKG